MENDVENSSMIIDEGNNNTIEKNAKKGLYEAFSDIKKYPNEFYTAITSCHN